MFTTRWRWVGAVALALPRFRGGRKVPPPLARMEAEDLLAAVFPDQVACAENLAGAREIPDHPLVRQTIADCLGEAMDLAGLETLLARLQSGEVRVVARDLAEPSPLALEVLSARPYAFLDDAPLEERRTQAVMARRWLSPEAASELGRLDPEAIALVRAEAWPDPVNADELHDALMWLGFLAEDEARAGSGWAQWLAELARDRRAVCLDAFGATVWIAAENQALWPPDGEALIEIVRGRLEGLGPVTQQALAAPLGLAPHDIEPALLALETEGFVLRGRFTAGIEVDEWCERRLLARIHRYTIKRLRSEIEPVAARDFLRFLFRWQRVAADARMAGPEALEMVVGQLEGFEAAAGGWETEILPARIEDYEPAWLDDLCLAGRIAWVRLRPKTNGLDRNAGPVRTTPITLLNRRNAPLWAAVSPPVEAVRPSATAERVVASIREHGASFFDELVQDTGLLGPQVEEALAELVALGLVTSDSFSGLRALLMPSDRRRAGRRRQRGPEFAIAVAGRWALARRPRPLSGGTPSEPVEHIAHTLLRRYGVVFRRLIEREAAWLPPWRDLLRVCRRLEARGDLRGGRFVAGFAGEQFALPEAIGMLRDIRRKPADEAWISVSGADPLNLVGILTPGPRLAALTTNRLLYRDGVPIALLAGGDVQYLETLEPTEQWQARKALLRGAIAGIGHAAIALKAQV